MEVDEYVSYMMDVMAQSESVAGGRERISDMPADDMLTLAMATIQRVIADTPAVPIVVASDDATFADRLKSAIANPSLQFHVARVQDIPTGDLAQQRVIYIGITIGDRQCVYNNYAHLRNLNLYNVLDFGFTWDVQDQLVDVWLPELQTAPIWKHIIGGRRWFEGRLVGRESSSGRIELRLAGVTERDIYRA